MPDENQVKHMQAQTRLLNAQAEAIELDNAAKLVEYEYRRRLKELF